MYNFYRTKGTGNCAITTATLAYIVLALFVTVLSGFVSRIAAAQYVTVEELAIGLARPVSIVNAGDGSGRLFIVLQGGEIVVHDGIQVLPAPFLDVSSLVSCCGEQGLLDIAFHPNYTDNGLFFISYTDTSGDSVVARYEVSADPDLADPDSAAVLLTVAQPFANHNGGQVQFGPDGFLYIALGDGGSGGDPDNRAQDSGDLLGKILRIDIDQGAAYAIPPDNPFVGVTDAREEVWALGLRNPWRFSFDRLTGDLFIADVGQGSREEVDFQVNSSSGGENYGWRLMEGSSCFEPQVGCNDDTLVLPILEYDHSDGNCAITGGYRYRGMTTPQADGFYFYADYCSGRIWAAAEHANGNWIATEVLDTVYRITSFGEDEAGELYFTHGAPSPDGSIYRMVLQEALSSLQPDDDSDGIADVFDNCPTDPNPGQEDNDTDGSGDVCDPDDDNDGVNDVADNCPINSNPGQEDNDADGAGDVCDSDDDDDGMKDSFETANGFDPLDPADAAQDADGDGFTNLEEFEAGSDPNDPSSIPRPKAMPWLKLLLLDD